MKHSVIALSLVIVVIIMMSHGSSASRMDPPPKHNQLPCAICTIGIGIIDSGFENDPAEANAIVDRFCKLFEKVDNGKVTKVCQEIWADFGPIIVEKLMNDESPDKICDDIAICKNRPQCRLYNHLEQQETKLHHLDYRAMGITYEEMKKESPGTHVEMAKTLLGLTLSISKRTGVREWPWDKVVDHLPFFDSDGDRFSEHKTLRGSAWRGKDCDDLNAGIYPGRKVQPQTSDAGVDFNCNGINGINTATNKTYKEELCAGTGQMGVMVLGDSASAHFHVPANLTSDQVLTLLEDEADFPFCSWSTGYQDAATCPPSPWPQGVQSIYLKMRQRNRCNHRDYENLSANGVRSSSMHTHMVNTTARSQQYDHPALVMFALVGNDVCNPHPGFQHMTTPTEFRQNQMISLAYLDSVLPAGSNVVFVGLEHGEMWNQLSNVQYPNNSIGGNVTYAQLWDFMDCLQLNPCWGWLNNNATARQMTIEWAAALDQQMMDIVQYNNTYKNFKVHYLENPDVINLKAWVASGGNPTELFEYIGGGHPSQLQHEMTATYLWGKMLDEMPQVLGKENPNNAMIEKLFGDQGGY